MPPAITQLCPHCQMPLVLPATYAGRTVACGRCGAAIVVMGGEAAPATGASLLPPSAGPILPPQAAGATDPLASIAESTPLVRRVRRPRSCFATGCLVVGIVSLAAAAIVGIVLVAAWLPGLPRPKRASGPDMIPRGAGKQPIDKREYTDASRKAVNYAGVLVRVDRVEAGKVFYRSKRQNLQTATPNYLIINLNIQNKSRAEPVEYLSWYDNQFVTGDGEPLDLELVDEDGVTLEVFPIAEAENVERHGVSSSLLPRGDDTNDSLVFKLPDDYPSDPFPSLYLKLPVAAVGDEGFFKFHIPGEMVRRREE